MGNALKRDLIGGTFLAPHSPPTPHHAQPHAMGGPTHQIIVEHRNCAPLGLYPSCEWDTRMVKKLIIDKKLAPIFKGHEERISPEYDECPICFYFYPGGLNRSLCCKQPICTECYLQVRKPSVAQGSCPFCNSEKYQVAYFGPKTKEERMREAEEEKKVSEAHLRMRKEEEEEDKRRELERQQKKAGVAEAAEKNSERTSAITISVKAEKTFVETKRSKILQDEDEDEDEIEKETKDEEEGKEIDEDVEKEVSERNQMRPESFGNSPPFFPATLRNNLSTEPWRNNTPDLEELMVMEAIRLSLLDCQNSNNSSSRGKK